LENSAVSETIFIAILRSRFGSRGSGTVLAAKTVDCFSYGESLTATIPLHVVTIADRYLYSCNNGPECLYYQGKCMHRLALKAKGGTKHEERGS
jgi:hypothetical protein